MIFRPTAVIVYCAVMALAMVVLAFLTVDNRGDVSRTANETAKLDQALAHARDNDRRLRELQRQLAVTQRGSDRRFRELLQILNALGIDTTAIDRTAIDRRRRRHKEGVEDGTEQQPGSGRVPGPAGSDGADGGGDRGGPVRPTPTPVPPAPTPPAPNPQPPSEPKPDSVLRTGLDVPGLPECEIVVVNQLCQ